MSVESIKRMTQQQIQLHEHKGPYYDKWLKAYTNWAKRHAAGCVRSRKMESRWLTGVTVFVRDSRRKHDNS
ncbi:unnamed protein product [marine sediment metagenome]|uniref:Uncharacterized protein n=1 Tax=marine sediment metagenome TaxID=412755 RepID=X1TJF2_9ZZZZ